MRIEDIPVAACKMENNSYILDVPIIKEEDLPFVSILTISKDRKKFFNLLINNWESFIYPRDKLEWIILDEGVDNFSNLIKPYADKNKNIKYELLNKNLSIPVKRNITVEKATHEILFHMDDDDYYFPDSILSKVRVLLHYKVNCVATFNVPIYNTINKLSYLIKTKKNISESSILFTKKIWKKKKFKKYEDGEGVYMINKRYNEVIDIPFFFNYIVLNHNTNFTKDIRYYEFNNDTDYSFIDFLDDKSKKIILDI